MMGRLKYKLCPGCGTQNNSNAMFCIDCGHSLENEPIKVRVKDGIFFKREVTSKVILFGNPSDKYQVVGPLLSKVSFDVRVEEDYSTHMELLMNKVQEVISVNNLDGVANLSISAFNVAVNGIENVTLIASGDGLQLK